ncbi:hypothetical protein [Halobellus inordinatus]|uniref:hypothetical protein n=1 Tax=Halobellus inordinatus TaxID=1126236 RepID=UPI00210EB797|nr:hypothetical protein [Halobellus inordinatus]
MVPLQFAIPLGIGFVLILFLIPIVLGFALAYWVYNDAERRGIKNAALWALAVGGLTLTTFFGGLLAFAVYVWQRE